MAAYRRVDVLTVTCRLTACTPGSAPGPTLGIEYGKPLPLSVSVFLDRVCTSPEFQSDLKPNSITLAGSELVRSWFETDSVMEFGFHRKYTKQ